MQYTTNQGQFSSILYEGGGLPNGIPAAIGGEADIVAFTLGGFQNPNDSGGAASFGVVMSSNPNDSYGDGSFYVGIPTGYVIRGVVQYDGGIAMNDPAKPNYFCRAPLLRFCIAGVFCITVRTLRSSVLVYLTLVMYRACRTALVLLTLCPPALLRHRCLQVGRFFHSLRLALNLMTRLRAHRSYSFSCNRR